jgi:hypothetical protein
MHIFENYADRLRRKEVFSWKINKTKRYASK